MLGGSPLVSATTRTPPYLAATGGPADASPTTASASANAAASTLPAPAGLTAPGGGRMRGTIGLLVLRTAPGRRLIRGSRLAREMARDRATHDSPCTGG